MSDALKSLGFALALCLVCGVMLTAAATRLKPLQNENMRIDRNKNILKAAGLIDEQESYAAARIDELFAARIVRMRVDGAGRIMDTETPADDSVRDVLPVYLVIGEEREILSYIIPINTRGLWGRIHGYLAVDTDGVTITGFTVYQHAETPGLGGEIEKKWFQDNFVGKKLVDHHGNFVSVGVAKGRVEDVVSEDRRPNYVDGISGATLTGRYLAAGMAEILSAYEPMSVNFRQNNIRCRMETIPSWCDDETATN
ncbi:MAG: Na+-translocating NADH-quinone reductase subunit C [Desulfobacteraceae bacterium]|jgi:Na+-transporting NADH:ubiquinone oxidoreductase subunit C|nr:MAG: Na+-translocating NADH-quinone reductase subunit C [Desulfobacteraceae bacterium]